MIVHHLNCATMCPVVGQRLVGGSGKMVCHCLLLETNDGLCLVDTGFGTGDVRDPKHLGAMIKLIGAKLDESECAVSRVTALGFKADDVRHVVPTHLDLDHAGGMPDFPKAKVHIYAREHAAAMARATIFERERYKPLHWAHGPNWKLYEPGGEAWNGFACVRDLEGLPPEILIVPLPGHTRGHSAIAVDTGAGWLLHCGDGYFYEGEMDATPSCPIGLSVFQTVLAMDNKQRLANQARLRDLATRHKDDVTLFSAHSESEFERASAKTAARARAAA